MASHTQTKSAGEKRSHKKVSWKDLSPKSVGSSTQVRYMVDRAYVQEFYAHVLGHDLEYVRAKREEERLMEEESKDTW